MHFTKHAQPAHANPQENPQGPAFRPARWPTRPRSGKTPQNPQNARACFAKCTLPARTATPPSPCLRVSLASPTPPHPGVPFPVPKQNNGKWHTFSPHPTDKCHLTSCCKKINSRWHTSSNLPMCANVCQAPRENPRHAPKTRFCIPHPVAHVAHPNCDTCATCATPSLLNISDPGNSA
jgi:hypothetical protein